MAYTTFCVYRQSHLVKINCTERPVCNQVSESALLTYCMSCLVLTCQHCLNTNTYMSTKLCGIYSHKN